LKFATLSGKGLPRNFRIGSTRDASRIGSATDRSGTMRTMSPLIANGTVALGAKPPRSIALDRALSRARNRETTRYTQLSATPFKVFWR
jgi:hypothetical protein